MIREPRSVLIVDDDLAFGKFVASVAARFGLRPQVVSGLETEWDSDRPDPAIVLLDLNMPGVDGLEALRRLAERRSRARIHVLSGSDARLLRSAVHLGRQLGLRMAEPIQKPVGVDVLRAIFTDVGDGHARGPESALHAPPTADELRLALERDELFLVFQPILDLATLEPRGAEALVRWRHPERGVVPPGLFVPLAEQSGLAFDLTARIMERALATASEAGFAWRDTPLSLSVNLATGALAAGDVAATVTSLLAAFSVAPHRLVLEVTESAALADRARILEVLGRLRLRGVELSIDDFGTGTSSLERVDQLPCTELKIERSFVADVLRRQEAAAIVRSTLSLARQLGLRTVAEGIEQSEILAWLRRTGCDLGQGFLFTAGLEAEPFRRWLEEWEAGGLARLAAAIR